MSRAEEETKDCSLELGELLSISFSFIPPLTCTLLTPPCLSCIAVFSLRYFDSIHCIILPFHPFLPLTLSLPLPIFSLYLTQEFSLLVCLICVHLSLSCYRNHSLMRMMRYGFQEDYVVLLLLFSAIQLIAPTILPHQSFCPLSLKSPVYHLIPFLCLCALLFSSLLHPALHLPSPSGSRPRCHSLEGVRNSHRRSRSEVLFR